MLFERPNNEFKVRPKAIRN